MKKGILISLFVALLFSCNTNEKKIEESQPENITSKVTVSKTDGKYQLKVDGEPFYINGAGLEYGNIEALAKHKGNSFRTWRVNNGKRSAKDVLDEAQKYGLKVAMGIEVARERHGFDYNDEQEVAKQLERIRQEILPIKDHPALLLWVVGNELNLRYTNPKVWDAVNDISKMLHEEDSNHLTTTTLAGISQNEITLIKERCEDLDILSLQMYGDLPDLPKLVREFGWEGPYMVTEWGATGHWEVPKTTWGAPIEEHSSLKAANYLKRYKGGIESDQSQCIGSYVFLWGNKQERTPTWYGIFLEDGKETESVDVMHYLWNDTWPENRTPQIEGYTLDSKTAYESVILNSGDNYVASAKITDDGKAPLNYRWELLLESTDHQDGGDHEERPDAIEIKVVTLEGGDLEFTAPPTGEYRLFVYVDDGEDHAATANIPFKVN
ncbi:MAG: beta-galactosidase [Bacteroidetes bacterium MedPE-SWsnd-G2]|nr:MAG: beta-galactosidase [Bacteroidetes bacterium MedPE-SWsnd-G2]